MKDMDFLPRSALKLSTLTLAIAAASFATTSTMAAECLLNDANDTTTTLGATSNGDSALAIGENADAQTDFSTAIGNETIANGTDALAIGDTANANGNSTTAVGGESVATGLGATAIGWQSDANAERAQAFLARGVG